MKITSKFILGGLLPGMLTFNCCKIVAQQKDEVKESSAEITAPAEKEAPKLSVDKVKQQVAVPEIAPGHCRIIGKIIAISPEREANATGICAQTPCRAKVKIQKIIGYGHSFNQTLAVDQELNAYFVFSLKPTDKLFPDMTTPLPGLKIGSSFQADISPSAEVAGTTVPWYQVGIYQIK